MKNLMKSIALATVFSMVASGEQNTQHPQKSAAEQHKEAIAEQTRRWIEETKNGTPSQERIEQIIAENRQKIEKIWEAERANQMGRNG